MSLPEVTVIPSFCTNCEQEGETRLLLTNIPFFRDVVIASFSCPKCGYQNNDLQLTSELQEEGEILTLNLEAAEDLDRQVIKSHFASVTIPILEFEIPAETQKGVATTVEGLISQAADALSEQQPQRLAANAEIGGKVQKVIDGLRRLLDREDFKRFKIQLDDPSGNSFIENPYAPQQDVRLESTKYRRTKEQLHAMGYFEEQSESPEAKKAGVNPEAKEAGVNPEAKKGGVNPEAKKGVKPEAKEGGVNPEAKEGVNLSGGVNPSVKHGADLPASLVPSVWDLAQPVDVGNDPQSIVFDVPCPHCGHQGEQKMCEIDIPGFRKCIIMAFACEKCGVKTNEVKPGGAIGDMARTWTLKVTNAEDLNRDILKSDMAGVSIPELELQLEPGTLGGLFSTVEGLILKIADEIERKFPFTGDAALPDRRQRLCTLLNRLKKLAAGQDLPFTLILEDASDLSHLGRRNANILFLTGAKKADAERDNGTADAGAEADDPNLTYVLCPRTAAQNELLGLTDMKTENYD